MSGRRTSPWLRLRGAIDYTTRSLLSRAVGELDEQWYLERYPDVAEGVHNGVFFSGRHHYLKHGRREGRRPAAGAEKTAGNAPRLPAACLEFAVPVPGKGVFLSGWLGGGRRHLSSVRLVASGRSGPELASRLVRVSRPDVRELLGEGSVLRSPHPGFVCLAPLDGPFPAAGPLCIEVAWADGAHSKACTTPEAGDAFDLSKRILKLLPTAHHRLPLLLDEHFGPAVEGIWHERSLLTAPPENLTYGAVPGNPSLSVIVPLFGRGDLLEYQLALFAGDPDFEDAELIYVLDDLRLSEALVRNAHGLAALYRVPFRLLVLESNRGYPGACNAGAAAARGSSLLFVNSDVMPLSMGWSGRLAAAAGENARTGAVGALLLFEDNSIQHAGMRFARRASKANLWFNEHPRKGFHSGSGLPGVPYSVPAVTGACLLAARPLFESAGGFSEDYIIGDFEDSDLSLKFLKMGLDNLVEPRVRLLHLERQSIITADESSWEEGRSLYNAWVHTKRWGGFIEELSASTGRFEKSFHNEEARP